MKATRDSFGEEVAQLGELNSNIVVLDADLSKSTKSAGFAKKFPERFFEMGIAEANMIGTAAGLALSGKIPFACSFGAFITGRYDQIRMSVSYNRANVKLIGTHAGVAIGEDGHSQMGLEDVGLLRALPNMSIFQPADHEEAKQIIRFVTKHHGPAYIRLTRQKMPQLYDENYSYQYGQWDVLHEGKDVALIATGELVHSCMAVNDLYKKDYSIINASTLKPIDTKLIERLSEHHKLIVTAEDHYVIGGLGSAVSECMAELGSKTPLRRIGVREFGESGTPGNLLKHFQLDAEGVHAQIQQFLR